MLESAPGPRTTVQSPLRWSTSPDWKLDYCNIERLTPEEIRRRRAEFDEGKRRAKEQREEVGLVRSRTQAELSLPDELDLRGPLRLSRRFVMPSCSGRASHEVAAVQLRPSPGPAGLTWLGSVRRTDTTD